MVAGIGMVGVRGWIWGMAPAGSVAGSRFTDSCYRTGVLHITLSGKRPVVFADGAIWNYGVISILRENSGRAWIILETWRHGSPLPCVLVGEHLAPVQSEAWDAPVVPRPVSSGRTQGPPLPESGLRDWSSESVSVFRSAATFIVQTRERRWIMSTAALVISLVLKPGYQWISTRAPDGVISYRNSARSTGTLMQPWLITAPKLLCQYAPWIAWPRSVKYMTDGTFLTL